MANLVVIKMSSGDFFHHTNFFWTLSGATHADRFQFPVSYNLTASADLSALQIILTLSGATHADRSKIPLSTT
jgi:hypothetical protein